MKNYQTTAIFLGILLGGSFLHGFNTSTEGNRIYGVDESPFVTQAPRRVSSQLSSRPSRQATSEPQEEPGCLACLLRWCCTTEEEDQEKRRRDITPRGIDRRAHHERSALLSQPPLPIPSSRREVLRARSERAALPVAPEPAPSVTNEPAPRRTLSVQEPGRFARSTETDIADTISCGSEESD